MKTGEKLSLCLLLLIAFAGSVAAQELITNVYGRNIHSLNGKWNAIIDLYDQGQRMKIYENRQPEGNIDFYEYAFEGGLRLNVPGDWNSQSPELKYYEGTVWYARHFDAKRLADKRQFLYFGAVSYRCKVYLNGKEIAEHEGGFTPFQVEVTDLLKDGDNFLAVEVNNRRTKDAIPAMAFDWWNYGGITRDVLLVKTPRTFIKDYFIQLDKNTPDRIIARVHLSDKKAGEKVTVAIAEKIVSYYLRDKDLAEDVLISDIVKAMPKVSCATLETVMNLAALNSTYQGHEHIYKDDVTDALLQMVYKLSKTDKSLDLTECQKIALHEAAHAVVGEILNPDSIGIVTIRGNQSCIGGFENGCSTYLKNEEELLNDITKTLAGKAGVSLIYGVMDVNASGDIQNANRLLDLWMTSLAGAGFSEVESANNRMSETRLFSSEATKAAKMEELYRRAYKILHDNRDFLLAVQKELLEHETLLNSDLAKIRESCT